MSKPYWHCPVCNGNFDHGETCDCEKINDDTELSKPLFLSKPFLTPLIDEDIPRLQDGMRGK